MKKFDRKYRMVMALIRGIFFSFSLSRLLALRSCCLGVAVKPQFVLSARDVRAQLTPQALDVCDGRREEHQIGGNFIVSEHMPGGMLGAAFEPDVH